MSISTALGLLAVLFGGGVGVSVVAQLVKQLFGMNSSHIIHLMVVAVSVLVACAQYVLQLKNLPVEILGVSTLGFYGASQFIYREAGPITSFLTRVQTQTTPAAAPTAVAAVDAVDADASTTLTAVTAPPDEQPQETTPSVEPAVEIPAATGEFDA